MTVKNEKIAALSDAELDARHAEKMRKKKAARDKIIATKTQEKGLVIVHTGTVSYTHLTLPTKA